MNSIMISRDGAPRRTRQTPDLWLVGQEPNNKLRCDVVNHQVSTDDKEMSYLDVSRYFREPRYVIKSFELARPCLQARPCQFGRIVLRASFAGNEIQSCPGPLIIVADRHVVCACQRSRSEQQVKHRHHQMFRSHLWPTFEGSTCGNTDTTDDRWINKPLTVGALEVAHRSARPARPPEASE